MPIDTEVQFRLTGIDVASSTWRAHRDIDARCRQQRIICVRHAEGKRIVSPPTDPERPDRNWFRRGIGILICFAPLILLLASLVHWCVYRGGGYYGLGSMAVGLFIGGLNAYLSFARPRLHHRRHGSMEGYRFISGAPIGSAAVAWGGLIGFGELPTVVVGLVVLVLDTGGLPWFLLMTWQDKGFWDD